MPQVCTSWVPYRSWLSGILNSAVQPSVWTPTFPYQTASQLTSHPSLVSTRSVLTPAAFRSNSKPSRLSK